MNRETIENATKNHFFEKLNKMGNPLTRLTKKREKNWVTNIRSGTGDITIDSIDMKRIIRKYCK